MKPEVTKVGIFDTQVCVPEDWTDDQARQFAERENPCGTTNGWQVRKQENYTTDAKERQPCEDRPGFVHIMLDA